MSHHQTIPGGLPPEGFVRMQQLVGDPGMSEAEAARLSTPDKPVAPRAPRPGVLPVTEQHLRAMIRRGDFPAPVRISPKVVLWKVDEIRDWIARQGATTTAERDLLEVVAPRGRQRR